MQIDSQQSFMQNIMAFARANNITAREIAGIISLSDSKLAPNALTRNPYPLLGTMTKEQAEAAIELVAPVELHDDFRKLKGYPERSIDAALQALVEQYPHDPAMQSLSDSSFGELFRFNREQRQRGGRYLPIKDCVSQEMSTALFSEMERGNYSPPESTGLALLTHLGQPPTATGLEAFCRETAQLMAAHELRSTQFQRAIYAHMYPEGNTRSPRIVRQAGHVKQSDIVKAIKSSNSTVVGLLNGTHVPTEAQVKAIIPLFHAASEQEFYDNANRIYAANTDLTPPEPSSASAELEQFGQRVKATREELSISQIALQWLAQGGHAPAAGAHMSNMMISYLEQGRRRLPLSPQTRSGIIEALGCESDAAFEAIATQIQQVQTYRDQHFTTCMEILANLGNDTAKDILASSEADKHYTPVQIRKACEMLGMSEAEIYRATQPEAPAEIIGACEAVARFVEEFSYARYLPIGGHHIGNERIGRRSVGNGARNLERSATQPMVEVRCYGQKLRTAFPRGKRSATPSACRRCSWRANCRPSWAVEIHRQPRVAA